MVVATAPSHGESAQSDHDQDRDGGLSPSSQSLSPALSSSPMPFLPVLETTLTPLSMDSDFDTNATSNATATHRGVSHTDTDIADDARERRPSSRGNTPLIPSLGFSSNGTLSVSKNGSHVLGQGANKYSWAEAKSASTPDASFSQTAVDGAASPASPVSPAKSTDDPCQPQTTQQAQQPILVKPKPLVRTASTKSVSLRHPTPDTNPRSASHASNIAQLEATAEKLSMTSSIDDAIRDLHDEQKRADSRRSSILAASIASIPEYDEPALFPLSKQISIATSLREANSTARHGGYSPGGFVMSPSSSIASGSARLRSGSNGVPKPDPDASTSLSRHGPGKSSIRSVRSINKPTLTTLAEIEPTSLTAAAMNAADRLAEEPEEDDALRVPPIHDADRTPHANNQYESSAHEYWDQPASGAHQRRRKDVHERPSTAGSDGTFEQAERAFADFDGAHCSPDVDMEDSVNFQTLFASPTLDMDPSFAASFNPNFTLEEKEPEPEPSRPTIPHPRNPPTARPKSYLDPGTGDHMFYYPARVPMMLNLPQKLSKKPKAPARDAQRPRAFDTKPHESRHHESHQRSASWLPEFHPEPLLNPLGSFINEKDPSVSSDPKQPQAESSTHAEGADQNHPESHAQATESDAQMSTIPLTTPVKRRSQIPDLNQLPPQLRASTYFELPSQQMPSIQLKDGSATNTLDDILNASAKAPVSAFTDHAFAGSLGNETYGADKKRKSHMKHPSTASDLHVVRKSRSSFFHLRKPSALSRHSATQEDKDAASTDYGDEHQPLAGSVNGEAAHKAGDESEEGEEGEEEQEIYGAPTTLLAELQMRKAQQKLRTRPAASAFPNGLHSTLLEMDTVAEVERQARNRKKINLAWEDPNSNQAADDDEDTPLGVLMANKGQEVGLVGAIAAAQRPLGLMERRDMEDNEPLSVRRNRLNGREAGPIQRMTIGRGMSYNPAHQLPSPQLRVETPERDESEEEGETLAERMRRLKSLEDDNNPLPQARPVSASFSAELFNTLGDTFRSDAADTKDAGKNKEHEVPSNEEEETLGQRRRRLQEEREAREREMTQAQLTGGRSSIVPQLTKRHSLADVLGVSRAKGIRAVTSDPRVEAERARQEEGARYQEDQKRKLDAFRPQMPASLSTTNLGKPGGFMAGRFNDGTGGGFGQSRDATITGSFGSMGAMPNPAYRASAMGNAFRVGGAMSTYGPPMATPYVNPYGAPQPSSTGQIASIERWRQGIL